MTDIGNEFRMTLDYLVAKLSEGVPDDEARSKVEAAAASSGVPVRYGIVEYLPEEFDAVLRNLKNDSSLFVKVASSNLIIQLRMAKK